MRNPFGAGLSATCGAALLLLSDGGAASLPNLPLDRPYTLRAQEPFLLERDHARMLLDTVPLSFAYPRACEEAVDGRDGCLGRFRVYHADSARRERLGFAAMAALENRAAGDNVLSTEGGILLGGYKGPASFALDARMFSESGDGVPVPYDREDVDLQDDSTTGSVSYGSYARYRGNLSLDLPFGRLTVARDAAHWGPGLLTNLTFHQDGVPFAQYVFSTRIGRLSITSLYGDLSVDDRHISTRNLSDKNLYAHRYELRLWDNVLAGVSEQLIMFEENKPYLFTPVFPLFVAKAFMYEHANNGNLSFDLAWRRPGLGAVYGEFLLDDLESPSSLILKDYRQNKWAFMAGMHGVREFSGVETGVIAEYSRIEPWVYTHFDPYTAQTSHLGYPLGNQQGPNSMSMMTKFYGRFPMGLYLSTQVSLLWKGTGPGSSVNEGFTGPMAPKGFLEGGETPELRVNPCISYVRGMAGLEAEAGRTGWSDWRARVFFRY